MRKFTYIDLFAGCGGLSEGFMQSGQFSGLAHVEWELPMVQTLRARLQETWEENADNALKKVIHFDIQKTDELLYGLWGEETKQIYGQTNHLMIQNHGLVNLIQNHPIDLIIGGPPCQAYSIAGRAQCRDGMKNDYRNYLFESFVKVVSHFQPKIFLFENVPGILSAKPGNTFVIERIFKAFKDIGYSIYPPNEIKNAAYSSEQFGVPQKRNRIIIIGVKDSEQFNLKEIYHYIDMQLSNEAPPTLKDTIAHLPKLFPLKEPIEKPGQRQSHQLNGNISHHKPRYHNQKDIYVFQQWVKNNMNTYPLAEKINFYNEIRGKISKHTKYRSLDWNKPSPTIVAHLKKDGLMFIHPDASQARSLTVKEAALLQSFPDDFRFIGSMGYCYQMIGNAVPPLMAKHIAIGIANFLNQKNKESK